MGKIPHKFDPGQMFRNSECLSFEVLKGYLEDNLDDSQKRAVEGHLVDCQLCTDALEGLRNESTADLQQTVSEINREVRSRTSVRTIPILNKRLVAAAAALLLTITAVTIVLRYQSNHLENIYAENYKVYPAPEDNFGAIAEPDQESLAQPPELNANAGVTGRESPAEVELEEIEDFIAEDDEPEAVSEVEFKDAAPGIEYEKARSAEAPPTITHSDTTTLTGAASPSTGYSYNWSPVDSTSIDSGFMDEIVVTGKNEEVIQSKEITRASGTNYADSKQLSEVSVSKKRKASEGNFYEGMVFYEDGNYGKALRKFNKVLNNDPNILPALFYGGLCNMELNQLNKAINNFDEVLEVSGNAYYDAAEWYKALALIKKKKRGEAREVLDDLSRRSGEYQDDAAKLLEDLE